MKLDDIFCRHCEKKNQSSYNFCTACGKTLEKKESKIVINQNLSDVQPSETFEEINRSSMEILNNVFGFASFKGLQEQVIDQVNEGGDAIVLMPTGGGKSLCYQIPALFRDGLGVVISPLIALMRDQVESLKQSGVRAATINSSLSHKEVKVVEQKILNGSLDLLYVSPERFFVEGFLNHLKKSKLSLIAIDEAHCVSQWGHDFRPEYLKLNILKSHFPSVPRLALTATADGPTRRDIIERLEIKEENLFVSSFDRPNIKYTVVPKEESKLKLINFIKENHLGDSGIVYCISRNKVETITQFLIDEGFNALSYHAGMDKNQKNTNQDKFYKEEGVIMVATIAFGMGIDKPDVRFVCHLDLPKSVEAYYQETGRAGRDGLKSSAWMAYGLEDLSKIINFIVTSNASENQKRIERQKLDALLGFCETTSCRRQVLLKYFGDILNSPCGNCDTCIEPIKSFDATVATQKALSCVYKTGQRFGAVHIIDVLLGNNSAKVVQLRHDKISTYGIGKEYSKNKWRSIIRQLVAKSLLTVDIEGHGGYSLGENYKNVLNGNEKIFLREDKFSKKSDLSKNKKPKSQVTLINKTDQTLFQALRSHRRSLAGEQKVAPFIIFHDATLLEMVEKTPITITELGRLTGVGKVKLERYGAGFLEVILRVGKNQP